MPKSTTISTNILKLIYQAVGISGIADNTATSPLTNLYVSLHTANPGTGGAQTTSEAAYPGYARVAIARSTSGWTSGTGTVNPAATISFPASTGTTSETETYFSIGTAQTGAGLVIHQGTLNPSIAMAQNVTPQLSTATTISEA
ncbi:hypothetical protein [Methylobacterium sp. 1030]|uniref:phage tail fiber protein n=1 Tax=Methylobacterium sp. 1030 TaxID=3156404 RepID=UPI00339831A3